MRVAQVMAGSAAGGAEIFFERLCMALAGAGDDVLPVIRRDAGREGRLRAAGLAPVALRFGGPLDLLTRPRVGAILRGFEPRVAVAWMTRAAKLTPPGNWVLVGRLGGYYDLRNFRSCSHLVANTRALTDWITGQGWPARQVHYLPNFAPDLAGATPLPRPELGVPEDVPLVLALGRLHPNKGFDVLVRALAQLPRAHIVIAGDGPERARLMQLARTLGVSPRLHLPGWRQDTGRLLAAADVFVCPSRHEPLGNVVLEAWSASRPVVAAAAQGPAELIRSGEDGLLVPTEDAGALAAAMDAVLNDRAGARSLAGAGRARYAGEFAETPVIERWRGFLQSVENA
jgi:glycosyltransferase involved in cell wall biosynthesis